jgi:hypothetical protein
LPWAVVDSQTIYNQWTRFPNEIDPLAAGLTLAHSPAGDFDASDTLDAADVDMLARKIEGQRPQPWWLGNAPFDLNGDRIIDREDHHSWVKDLKHTWFGDADLNGEFNSNDMVEVFAAGKYETGEAAGWADGNWNCDGVFDSSDMVTAFVDGGYEKGPRVVAVTVPEPDGTLLLVMGLSVWLIGRRTFCPI